MGGRVGYGWEYLKINFRRGQLLLSISIVIAQHLWEVGVCGVVNYRGTSVWFALSGLVVGHNEFARGSHWLLLRGKAERRRGTWFYMVPGCWKLNWLAYTAEYRGGSMVDKDSPGLYVILGVSVCRVVRDHSEINSCICALLIWLGCWVWKSRPDSRTSGHGTVLMSSLELEWYAGGQLYDSWIGCTAKSWPALVGIDDDMVHWTLWLGPWLLGRPRAEWIIILVTMDRLHPWSPRFTVLV